jgi:NADH-quinone oxidoreductase subunit E
MSSATDATPVPDLFGQFDSRRANLIPLLQCIQASYRYLPEENLRRVARKLQLPIAEVYRVATFYRCFSLQPRGRHLLQVCQGTACHVRGSDKILERVKLESGAVAGPTSPDGLFTVEAVRCLGCCGLAPVVRVDRDTYGHLEINKLRGMLNRYRGAAVSGAGARRV